MNQTQMIQLTTNTLMVHLKLDSVRAPAKPDLPATVPDASGNSHGADVYGSPKLVVDEQFGSCLRLNCSGSAVADYLELPMAGDISTQGWTFSSWLFLESDRAQILYAGGVADFYISESILKLGNVGEALQCEPSVTRNQWVHVAVAVQASGDASVWIDGRLAGQGNIGAATLPDPAVWRVGRYAGDDTNWIFPGNLAHVRLYGKALSTAEIQRQRSLDWAPTQAFRVSSPLEFALWDEQQTPALYVAGGEIAHKLTVAIWNKDAHRRPVTFNAPEEIAKIADENERNDFFRRNHHLELRFPTGTLSKNASAGLNADLERHLAKKGPLGEEIWYIYYQDDPDANSESLSLPPPAEKTMEMGDAATHPPALEIVLPRIAADAEAEAQVLPVELRPGPLAQRQGDPATLLGPRIRTVEVLSQRGRKSIPLHFDVVGSDIVLNDGSSKTALLLRITNVDREVALPIVRTGNLQTRLILACEITDQGGHQEWALTDEPGKVTVQVQAVAGVGSVEPDPDVDDDWHSDPIMASTNGRMVEWVIDGEQLGADKLQPNDSVYLRLTVQTGLRTGPTDVHLYYRHIPGYWDGSRACTIQKSPLVFHHAGSGLDYVGIGTNQPASRLAVTDGLTIGSDWAHLYKAPVDGLLVQGNVGIGTFQPSASLHVKQEGEGKAAQFEGGSGVAIGGVAGATNALTIYNNTTSSPTLAVVNNGAGAALYAKQEGAGNAAWFVGPVHIEGDLDVHGKTISNYHGFPTADDIDVIDNVICNQQWTHTHNFGHLPSLVQVWVRSDGKNDSTGVYKEDVQEWKMAGVLSLWEGGASYGVVIEKIGTDTVVFSTGNAGLFHGTRAGNNFASGQVRLMVWK